MSKLSELTHNLIPHHICIQTNDYEKSKSFYLNVLGFSLVEETPNFNGRAFNSWFEKSGFYIEMQTPKEGRSFEPIHTEVAGINHLCFYSPELQSLFESITLQAPNTILKPLYTVFSTQLFKICAPEGTIIEFRNTKNC